MLFIKLSAKVFNTPPDHYVFDPQNNPDETTQIKIKQLFTTAKFSAFAGGQMRLFDKFFYGPSIFNPVWQK
jgi:hypothetical protein